MNYLHTEFWGGSEAVALITLDGQANVFLLDDASYSAYCAGRSYQYRGGWASRSPVKLSPTHHGHWPVVIDLGDYAGTVRAGVLVI